MQQKSEAHKFQCHGFISYTRGKREETKETSSSKLGYARLVSIYVSILKKPQLLSWVLQASAHTLKSSQATRCPSKQRHTILYSICVMNWLKISKFHTQPIVLHDIFN